MSVYEFYTLFSMPIAGLVIAGIVYYVSRHQDGPNRDPDRRAH